MQYNQRKLERILVQVIILTFILSVSVLAAAPKNIILLIGDGMGIGTMMAARIAEGGPSCRLAMDTMPEAAVVTTYSASSLVTDSAAAATALASGVKTKNGMLGMTPDKHRVRTILEAAQGLGKSTGLVTTVTITHATPAGFIAHIEKRGEEPAIAEQLAESGVDVLLGGGTSKFIPQQTPGSNRKDSKDIIGLMMTKGYDFVDTKDKLLSSKSPKILGLFWSGGMTEKSGEPSLAEMAQKSIDTLSRNPKGFFLMVEGGQIDWVATKERESIRETVEFDAAVKRALDFAKRDGHTLVVVTADHDTGGLAVRDNKTKLKEVWIDAGHTGNPVQLYAYGPGSELFNGFMDNTDVPKRFAQLWRVKIGLP